MKRNGESSCAGAKENFQKRLDRILEEISEKGERKRLLLHACCAPCSSAVLEYLSRYFQITILFYNPNIETEEEYFRRAGELKRLLLEMGLSEIRLLLSSYRHEEFLAVSRGLEREPERGKRCRECFRLRLEKTAEEERRLELQGEHFDYFCTTLSLSPLKDAALLNRLGTEIAERQGLHYLPSDFKKGNRFLRSVQLSKEYSLYRQDYCGCEFSREEAGRRRAPSVS